MDRRTISRLVAALAVTAALVVAGCAVNPATGRKELSLVSADQERKLGEEGHGAILAEYGRYDDPGLQAYVDSIGQSLAKVSHLPDLRWTFTLLDDPVVNAFAMPGGYIYVTRGILAHLGSEAQLAGVLGHELGHVTARHTAQRMTQQQLAGLGLGLASVFSATVRQYSETAQQALGLMFLKYGRDDETQSDRLGVDYTAQAGWDPREIPATYEMLGRVSDRAGQRLPSFLSTHPDPGDRQQRTAQLAASAASGRTGLRVRQREYLARIDGILYGRDPRDGYFEGDRYYHPRSALQLTLPAGWQHQDSRQALMSAAPGEKAMLQVSMAKPRAATPSAHVQALLEAGTLARPDGAAETVGGWPAWVGRVAVRNDQGAEVRLLAAFVVRSPEQMIQVVGQNTQPGDADDQKMLDAVRTIRPLTDAAKLHPPLRRLKVANNPAAGAFATIAPRLAGGANAVPIEDLAVLNNLAPDAQVPAGRPLKVVTAAATR